MREADWLRQVRDLARVLGWRCYHHPYSLGADPGFPDLVLVRDRVIFAELKGPRGKLHPEQERWIEALRQAGAEVYVWYPDDLADVIATLRARRTDTSAVEADSLDGTIRKEAL